ncbi:hypothetical protein [Fodinicola acaciae]|uniref:hypothetical protein n=1 Tax=Fodinicola acaciae TaxID=2681555 RepID=UPI0013D304E4|nr:hypothetical protein [Fodinicola acaciae]
MTANAYDSTADGSEVPIGDIRQVIDLVRRLASLQRSHRPYAIEVNMQDLLSIDLGSTNTDAPPGMGRVRKVSVSLPENLIATLQQRLGKGEFSQYVTESVARQLQFDLLAELADELDEKYGPVPEELVEEALAEWPDAK